MAEYDAAAQPLPPAAAPPPQPLQLRPPPPAAPPLVVQAAPAGFRLPTPAQVAKGPALVVGTVLYYWPCDGWVRGTVARRSRTRGFSHVVRYGPGLGRRWAPRWSTRCSMPPRTARPAAGSCCARRASRPVA